MIRQEAEKGSCVDLWKKVIAWVTLRGNSRTRKNDQRFEKDNRKMLRKASANKGVPMRCTGPNPIKLSTLHRFPAFLFNKNTYCMEFPSSLHSYGVHTSGGIEMDGSTAMKIFSMSALKFWAFSKKFIIPFSRYFVTFRFGVLRESVKR